MCSAYKFAPHYLYILRNIFKTMGLKMFWSEKNYAKPYKNQTFVSMKTWSATQNYMSMCHCVISMSIMQLYAWIACCFELCFKSFSLLHSFPFQTPLTFLFLYHKTDALMLHAEAVTLGDGRKEETADIPPGLTVVLEMLEKLLGLPFLKMIQVKCYFLCFCMKLQLNFILAKEF